MYHIIIIIIESLILQINIFFLTGLSPELQLVEEYLCVCLYYSKQRSCTNFVLPGNKQVCFLNHCRLVHQSLLTYLLIFCYQDNHLTGKIGNVRDFDSCQGNAVKMIKSQGSMTGNIVGKMFNVNMTFRATPVFSCRVAA